MSGLRIIPAMDMGTSQFSFVGSGRYCSPPRLAASAFIAVSFPAGMLSSMSDNRCAVSLT